MADTFFNHVCISIFQLYAWSGYTTQRVCKTHGKVPFKHPLINVHTLGTPHNRGLSSTWRRTILMVSLYTNCCLSMFYFTTISHAQLKTLNITPHLTEVHIYPLINVHHFPAHIQQKINVILILP